MLRTLGRLRAGGQIPTLLLDFTTALLDSRIDASGGSGGTRVNSSGVIVAATTPRFDYDPITLACKGVLVEEQRTNLLLNSKIDGTNLSTQSVSVTAQAYTLSFYGSGTVTLSGAAVATVNGAGAYPNRQTYSFTPSAGTLTLTVSGTVQFSNLEAGSFATSFIPTGGSAVTRTADSLVMTGSNFSSWFNAVQGALFAEYTPNVTTPAVQQFIAQMALDSGNYIALFRDTSNGRDVARIRAASVDGMFAYLAGSPVAAGVVAKSALAYAANDGAGSLNGAAAVTATPTLPTGLTTLGIGGAAYTTGVNLNGWIRRLRYYPQRLPNSTLQVLTT